MPQGPVEETGGVGGHTRNPVALIKSQICVSFDLAVHSPQTACGGHGQECPLGGVGCNREKQNSQNAQQPGVAEAVLFWFPWK